MFILITVTLAAILASLWIRRDTWRSRWEVDASLNVALQGLGVLLMSPWVSTALGPPLYRISGLWNVQHLLGHLCLIVAATAIIRHGLVRLAGEPLVGRLFRRQVLRPLQVGVPLLVALLIAADEGHHRDLLPAHVHTGWLGAYWLLLGGLLIYLLSYAGRVLLIVREDPRSRATVDLYLIAVAFGVAASVIQVAAAWAGIDVALPVWSCACPGAIGFAYASARSWQAKIDWFVADRHPPMPEQPNS